MNDPEPQELVLLLESQLALLKPRLVQPSLREKQPSLCLLLGCSSASSVGPGTVSGFRGWGQGCWFSPQPLIWTICLNSALLANASVLPPCCQPPSTVPIQQGSCVFTDRLGLGKGQALCRGGLPRLCHRGLQSPTPDLQALLLVIQHFVADPGKDGCQGCQRLGT